jgi:hypothetical protein
MAESQYAYGLTEPAYCLDAKLSRMGNALVGKCGDGC